MDLAFDYIHEDADRKDGGESKDGSNNDQPQQSLNSEIQEAYKTFSSSSWGVSLGGFLGNVRKQGESVYTQASKELAEVREDATKGITGLQKSFVEQTRNLTVHDVVGSTVVPPDPNEKTDTETREKSLDDAETHESETVLSRLRTEAAKRLKDLQRAEDAADEALLKFGGNVRDFLRDAINIAPPGTDSDGNKTVLFESKDSKGKRVIHTSRFDAQLHVIHTTTDGFMKDPSKEEYESWSKGFDIDKKTEDIAGDLNKYPELRITMEKLVPDQIPYADFWKRYYYLRHGIETAEARRRDLLKAASTEDEVGWGDESDDEDATPAKSEPSEKPASVASSTTIHPPKQASLKPTEPRNSNDEKSQAGSEASYDVVGAASGMTSQAPNSPKDTKKSDKSDDSDDDWE